MRFTHYATFLIAALYLCSAGCNFSGRDSLYRGSDSNSPVSTEPAGACRLPPVAGVHLSLGYPRDTNRLHSIGQVNAAVLFGAYTNVVPDRTPEEAMQLLSPGGEDFFEAISYGRMRLQLHPHLEWLSLNGTAADFMAKTRTSSGHRSFIAEAMTLADASFDFSNIDLVIVVSPPNAADVTWGPAWLGNSSTAIEVDGAKITNGTTSGADILRWGSLWLPHEMGHLLGLPDLYAASSDYGFTRPFSLMDLISGEAPEPLAYERWFLDWIDDNQIVCNPNNGSEVLLTPIESIGNNKAVIVTIDQHLAVVAESRRAQGFDSALRNEGVIVYVVDTRVGSLNGPINLRSNRIPLLPGQAAEYHGVIVEVVSADTDGDVVRIMR